MYARLFFIFVAVIAMQYTIKYDPSAQIKFRGDNEKLFYNHNPEVMLSGPAETGKTFACCWKAHILACHYPGCQGAIVRQEYSSMHGTVLTTFNKVISGAPVVPFGGEHVEKYIYANDSVIWIGGMDKPDKVLSGERDFIYVNQAEQLKLNGWELMTTRCTGRAAVIPHPQIYGDCNPGPRNHWILDRAFAGALTLLKSFHRDNPMLFDDAGNITAQGKRTMAVLDHLTGVRLKRLRDGIWSTAEGAVYDMFDAFLGGPHVCERDAKEMVRWYLACDEGYTDPAVILLVGEDSDGRWHVFDEFYETGKLQQDVVAFAKSWADDYHVELVAVDNSAAGLIADMINNNIPAVGGKGRVLDNIGAIQNRLKVQGDGRARLTVDPKCVNTINEFESFSWKQGQDMPEHENSHTPSALWYLHNVLNENTNQIFI